jgi:hypothetical protein
MYIMFVLLQNHWDILSKHMHCSSLYLHLLYYASVTIYVVFIQLILLLLEEIGVSSDKPLTCHKSLYYIFHNAI